MEETCHPTHAGGALLRSRTRPGGYSQPPLQTLKSSTAAHETVREAPPAGAEEHVFPHVPPIHPRRVVRTRNASLQRVTAATTSRGFAPRFKNLDLR